MYKNIILQLPCTCHGLFFPYVWRKSWEDNETRRKTNEQPLRWCTGLPPAFGWLFCWCFSFSSRAPGPPRDGPWVGSDAIKEGCKRMMVMITIIIMNETFRSPVFDDKVNLLWHQLVKSLPMLVVLLELLMAVCKSSIYLYRVAPPQVLVGSSYILHSK